MSIKSKKKRLDFKNLRTFDLSRPSYMLFNLSSFANLLKKIERAMKSQLNVAAVTRKAVLFFVSIILLISVMPPTVLAEDKDDFTIGY